MGRYNELNSSGDFLCKHTTSEKGLGYQNGKFLSLHAHFRNTVKPIPHISSFNLTLKNVQIPSSKPDSIPMYVD